MRIETADTLLAPLLPVNRAHSVAAADWMRAFALARIGVLGLSICALPMVLVAAPAAMPGLFGLFVALVLSSVGGLLGLRAASPSLAVLAAAAGLGAVLAGPLPAAAAPVLLAVGLIAALCDIVALPPRSGGGAARIVAVLLALLPGMAALMLDRFGGWDEIFAALVPVLALAPVLTLVLVTLIGRARLDDRAGAAAAAEARAESLLAAADIAVLVVDRGGHVMDQSEAAADLLGCDAARLAGRGLIDRALIADRPALLKAVSQAVTAATPSDLLLRLCVSTADAEGRLPPVFAAFRLRTSALAGRPGCAAIRIETAESVVTDGSLTPAVSEERLALLQQIAHEVRTPMNAILGFSEVLVEAAVAPKRPEQVVDYARIIHRSAREAFAISTALVDLMRAEAGATATEREPHDLAEIAGAAARQVNERAPVPVRVENAADEVLLETDAHACRTLLKAVLESFSTAFDGRSQVLCQVGRLGLTPQIVVTARDLAQAAPVRDIVPAGHFGVMEALCARLAGELGCRIALDLDGPALSACIEFPRAVALRPRATLPQSVVPLRKSA